MSSKSLKTFRSNTHSIFESYVNIRLLGYLKDFARTQKEKLSSKDLNIILDQFDLLRTRDKTMNYLFISTISTMELYLKERLIEELRKDDQLVISFLRKYELPRKLNVDDVIKGPKELAEEIINGIIYHNIEKVNKIYKLIFNIQILNFVDMKLLKTDIEFRHLIVHSASKARNKELVVQDGFIRSLNRISRFIESIDYYFEHHEERSRATDFYGRSDRIFRPIHELDSMEDILSLCYSELNVLDKNKEIMY